MADSRSWLHVAWWLQLGVSLLALPWMYFRTKSLIQQVPAAQSLGEGAANGVLIGSGLIIVVIGALLYAVTLAIPTIVGLFGSWSNPGPAMAALIVSVPWSLAFFLLAVLDGIWPLAIAAALTGLAITSAVQVLNLRAERQKQHLPDKNFEAQPPPPPPPPARNRTDSLRSR